MRNQLNLIGRLAESWCLLTCIAVVLGIFLSSAALAQDSQGDSGSTQETERHNMDRVATDAHGQQPASDEHDDAGGDSHATDDHAGDGHGSDHEADFGQRQAAKIAVHEPPSWYGGVIWGSGLLFVLAATLGSVAIVMKGPEPPDPADAHGHGHDDDHHGGGGHH